MIPVSQCPKHVPQYNASTEPTALLAWQATREAQEMAARRIQANIRRWHGRKRLRPTPEVRRAANLLTLESVSIGRIYAQTLKTGSPTKRVRERDFTKAASAEAQRRVPVAPGSTGSHSGQVSSVASAAVAARSARRIQATYARYRERKSIGGQAEPSDLDRGYQGLSGSTGVLQVLKIQAVVRGRQARRKLADGARIVSTARLRVQVHQVQKLHGQAASAVRGHEEAQSFLASARELEVQAIRRIQAWCSCWLARKQLLAAKERLLRVAAAAVKIQAVERMRKAQKLRREKARLQISMVAGIGVRAVRVHKLHDATSSPRRSPSAVGFLTVTRGPVTDSDSETRHQAACKIQAVHRGRIARREVLSKRVAAKQMDIAAISQLRVKVHKLHASLAASSKPEDDGSFFGMFADTAQDSEEKAATRIQACFRGQKGRKLAAELAATSFDMLGPLEPVALQSVRRSLVAAGFAVVGEANAEIGRMLHRASQTVEEAATEAAAMGDRAAQRASIALGETLLHMVVDASSPPVSPTETAGLGSPTPSSSEREAGGQGKEEALHQGSAGGEEVGKLSKSVEEACTRVQAWLEKRHKRKVPATAELARPTGLSPLAQRRRELARLTEAKPKAGKKGLVPLQNNTDPPQTLASLKKCADIRRIVTEEDMKLNAVQLAPFFPPGSWCSRNCGQQPTFESFSSVSSEVEFSFWGFCPLCQGKLGMAKSCHEQDYVLVGSGHFEALSPFHAIPVAYPNARTVWASPYHLFIAHHFVDPRCQEAVRGACNSTASASFRALVSEEPLRSAVRNDWHFGWAVKAMRHSIFLALDQHPALAALLVRTGHARIVFIAEGRERYWGTALENSTFIGENLVGKILEEKRALLRLGADS